MVTPRRQGQPLGYIEVQQKIDRLEEIVFLSEREIRTTILLGTAASFTQPMRKIWIHTEHMHPPVRIMLMKISLRIYYYP